MAKDIISATVDQELLKKLAEEAKRTDRSRSWLISRALREYLERQASDENPEQRLDQSEQLLEEARQLNPRPLRPFAKSFRSFADYERWRRAQKDPWR